MTDPKKEFNFNLQFMHEKYGTWQKVADKMGIGVRHLHKLRSGERKVTKKRLTQTRRSKAQLKRYPYMIVSIAKQSSLIRGKIVKVYTKQAMEDEKEKIKDSEFELFLYLQTFRQGTKARFALSEFDSIVNTPWEEEYDAIFINEEPFYLDLAEELPDHERSTATDQLYNMGIY